MGKFEDIILENEPEAPVANNSLRVKDLYSQRVKYKESLNTEASDGTPYPFIDLWYDKTQYGQIDDNQNSVYPSETNLVMLVDGVMVLDFVASAFKSMSEKWREMQSMGILAPVGLLKELVPEAGWYSIHEEYHLHMEDVFADFQTYARSEGRSDTMISIQDYMKVFTSYVAARCPEKPITRSSFLFSQKTNIMSTGLAIELAHPGIPHDNDYSKWKALLQDENFEAFALIARQYGFYIDKNAPFRLIANINSETMQAYMKYYGINGTTQLFRKYYYKAYAKDMIALAPYMTSMWNSFATSFPFQRITYSERDNHGNHITKAILRQRSPTSDIDWGDGNKMVRFYFYLRCKEAGLNWSQVQFNKHLKEVIAIFQKKGNGEAMKYVNRITKQILSPGGNPSYRISLDNTGNTRYTIRGSSRSAGNFRLQINWG
jgi:hypothetical protein